MEITVIGSLAGAVQLDAQAVARLMDAGAESLTHHGSFTGKPASGVFAPDEPIGLLADIHANLPAFEAVLAALDARGVRQDLMLGDVDGYGPNPKACIDLIRQRNIHCLRGNHDHYVAHQGDVRVAMGLMAKRMAKEL